MNMTNKATLKIMTSLPFWKDYLYYLISRGEICEGEGENEGCYEYEISRIIHLSCFNLIDTH